MKMWIKLNKGEDMLINYSTKELDLCARIMRAEALAEGDLGMLMVGNVVVKINLVGLNLVCFKVRVLLKKKNLLKGF